MMVVTHSYMCKILEQLFSVEDGLLKSVDNGILKSVEYWVLKIEIRKQRLVLDLNWVEMEFWKVLKMCL